MRIRQKKKTIDKDDLNLNLLNVAKTLRPFHYKTLFFSIIESWILFF